MAVTLDELKVLITAETKPFQQRLKQVENQVKRSTAEVSKATNSIRGMFASLGSVVAFGAMFAGLYKLGQYSIQTALEVRAAMNQIQRTMGESTQSFLKWAENNALAFNMSKGEAIKYGAVYSNLFANFIHDSEKLSAYTAKMLETSAIVAEGTGRNITDVMERIRSGLLGNTEAIEDLGIMVNVSMIESTEAFKKFANGQSWEQLNFQTQQQIRLMAILEQATARYGDTLEGSVNGQIARFKALMKDSALNLGNAFLPVIEAIMPTLNAFANAVRYVTAKLAELVQLLFNKKVTSKDGVAGAINNAGSGLGKAAGNANDLGNALDDAGGGAGKLADGVGKAGKEAKKAAKELLGLMGFDEINILSQKNADSDSDLPGGGSPGGGGGKGGKGGFKDILPDIEITDRGEKYESVFDGLMSKLQPLFDLLKRMKGAFEGGFIMTFRAEGVEKLKEAIRGIKESLAFIFSDGKVLEAYKEMLVSLSYALGQVTGAIANVALGIGIFIAESINKGLRETKLEIKEWLIRSFRNVGHSFSSLGNIAAKISDVFYDTLTSEGATRIGGAFVSSIIRGVMGTVDLFWKHVRVVLDGVEKVVDDNAPKLTDAITGSLEAVAPIFETFSRAVKDTFDMFNRVYDDNVKPFIDSFFSGWSEIIGHVIDGYNEYINPVLSEFGKKFVSLYEEHIKPVIDKFGDVLGKAFELLRVLWEVVLQPLFDWIAQNVMSVLAPIAEFLYDSFITYWKILSDTLKGFLEIIEGILDFIIGVFTGDWERAWQGIKEIFKGVWDIITAIPKAAWEAIKEALSPIAEWFKEKFESAVAFVKEAFKNIGKWFEDRYNDIKTSLKDVDIWFKDKFDNTRKYVNSAFEKVGTWFSERYSDIKSALNNAPTWFGEIFGGAYRAVQEAFSSIGTFFSEVWQSVQQIFVNAGQRVGDAVGGAFKGAVNAVLGTIENIVNGFVNMINGVLSVANSLPGVSVGYLSGISLPRLARGGIVDSPTVAMIGEAGKEVVMPLENTGFLQTMGRVVGSAVVSALGTSNQSNKGSNYSGEVVINIDGSEFARVAINKINEEQERVGETLLRV